MSTEHQTVDHTNKLMGLLFYYDNSTNKMFVLLIPAGSPTVVDDDPDITGVQLVLLQKLTFNQFKSDVHVLFLLLLPLLMLNQLLLLLLFVLFLFLYQLLLLLHPSSWVSFHS
jgi:hypothetical protein